MKELEAHQHIGKSLSSQLEAANPIYLRDLNFVPYFRIFFRFSQLQKNFRVNFLGRQLLLSGNELCEEDLVSLLLAVFILPPNFQEFDD